LDVTDDESVAGAVKTINDAEGHLDVLIDNAGISDALPPPAEVTADDVRRVYDTNVFGVVRVTKTASAGATELRS
jgi:NAD(P)-dependent dehydrogenase (short-subunit alcohol dehydrogenase family)